MLKQKAKKIVRRVVPKYIDFGFHVIKVEELTDKQMFDLAELEEGEYIPEGLWDTDVDTVYVLKKLDWKKKRYYLMHEMVHACLDLMDSLETGP